MNLSQSRVRQLVGTACCCALLGSCGSQEDDHTVRPSVGYPFHQDQPSWSRQGLIAYIDKGIVCVGPWGNYRRNPDLAGVWIIDPVTRERHHVTSGDWLGPPGWSPDGSKLAMVNYPDRQVFISAVDGSSPQQITFEGWNFFPAWSPDGTTIAHDNLSSERRTFTIWLVSIVGSSHTMIASSDTVAFRQPCWSADGAWLLHVRSPMHGCSGLWIMDRIGQLTRELTCNTGGDQDPQFSPDGTMIAFTRRDPYNVPHVWLMNADGTSPRQLLVLPSCCASWSPDGSRLVYVRADISRNTPDSGVLWILDLESHEETQLTEKWPQQCD